MRLIIFILLIALCCTQLKFGKGERITNLPGLDATINFKQYSGYITVDETKKTRLFYWFIESQSNASTDPLVLWLNGGPGCSSLGGFFEELGPFYSKPNKKLGINEHSWNKVANMVFLEAPAGVGFSKTDTPITYNDEVTAMYSMKFLVKFFEMYPHLKSLDFWITGQSYAGHFIPQLATKVLEHNEGGSDVINLKGLMIGNPLTVLSINNGATVETMYDHHLISIGTYKGLRQNCNYTFPDVPQEGASDKNSVNPFVCGQFQFKAHLEMGYVNPNNIYVDVCHTSRGFSNSNSLALLKYFARANTEMSVYAKSHVKQHMLRSPYDPCRRDYLLEYLNDRAVQKAIFAEPTNWTDCDDDVGKNWSRSDVSQSIVPIYTNKLFHHNLRILIYSGDVDTIVPTASTRFWLHTLHLNTTKPWHPWIDSRGQVGGYTSATKEITFATVRDAGHEVPSYQPLRAYNMFTSFLKGVL